VITTSVLKNRHPALWEKAGSFALFANNTPVSGWKMIQFIFSDGYKATGDRTVAWLIVILRLLFVTCAVLFALGVAKGLRPGY